MAGSGVVNNFYFDENVFTDYMQEQSCLNNLLIVSGILQHDPIIESMVGNANNIFTIPYFLPIDGEEDAKNDDGKTDNTPTELKGGKQTGMAIARMKAWTEKTYTRYLTGKSPLHNLADNLIIPYWENQWEKTLMSIIKGIMGVDAMKTHVLNLSTTSGTITEANKISLTTHIELGQQALGDKRSNFALFVCHSQVAANYRKLELLENKKFFSPILGSEITVPMIGNMIVLETDTNTVDATVANFPVYSSFMLGRGVILTCDKEVHKPYGVEYSNEKKGGTESLYTKQAKVFHPNGFSLKTDSIAEESPTNAELEKSANWELKFNHKNIAMAMIKSNG